MRICKGKMNSKIIKFNKPDVIILFDMVTEFPGLILSFKTLKDKVAQYKLAIYRPELFITFHESFSPHHSSYSHFMSLVPSVPNSSSLCHQFCIQSLVTVFSHVLRNL